MRKSALPNTDKMRLPPFSRNSHNYMTNEFLKAVRASDFTHEQKKNALHVINLIKEKRNGVLKGRTVTDGRKQRKWYSKDEITSPTISHDSLMALLKVSVAERRKIISWGSLPSCRPGRLCSSKVHGKVCECFM